MKLDRLGARLALTDVSQGGLDKTLELIGGDKGRHYAHVLDVSKPDEVEGQVAAIVARFGRIDHVFNCAGINPTAMPLTDCTDDYYDRLMAVNLKGVFSVTRATMPHMTAPGGSYVNVSSIMGLHAGNGSAIYCATKWGEWPGSATSSRWSFQGVRGPLACQTTVGDYTRTRGLFRDVPFVPC